jgi:hypothetical protein
MLQPATEILVGWEKRKNWHDLDEDQIQGDHYNQLYLQRPWEMKWYMGALAN